MPTFTAAQLTEAFSNTGWSSPAQMTDDQAREAGTNQVELYRSTDAQADNTSRRNSGSFHSLDELDENDLSQEIQAFSPTRHEPSPSTTATPLPNIPVFIDTPFGVIASLNIKPEMITSVSQPIFDMMKLGVVAVALQNVPSPRQTKPDSHDLFFSALAEVFSTASEPKPSIHSTAELKAGFARTHNEDTGFLVITNTKVFPSAQIKSLGLGGRSAMYELTTAFGLTVQLHNLLEDPSKPDETRRYFELSVQLGHIIAGNLDVQFPPSNTTETMVIEHAQNAKTFDTAITYNPYAKLLNYHVAKAESNKKRSWPVLFKTDSTKETAAKKLLDALLKPETSQTFTPAELSALIEKHHWPRNHSELREAVLHAVPYETVLNWEAALTRNSEYVLTLNANSTQAPAPRPRSNSN